MRKIMIREIHNLFLKEKEKHSYFKEKLKERPFNYPISDLRSQVFRNIPIVKLIQESYHILGLFPLLIFGEVTLGEITYI